MLSRDRADSLDDALLRLRVLLAGEISPAWISLLPSANSLHIAQYRHTSSGSVCKILIHVFSYKLQQMNTAACGRRCQVLSINSTPCRQEQFSKVLRFQIAADAAGLWAQWPLTVDLVQKTTAKIMKPGADRVVKHLWRRSVLVLRCMLSSSRNAASKLSEWKLPKADGRLKVPSLGLLTVALESSCVVHSSRLMALSKMSASGSCCISSSCRCSVEILQLYQLQVPCSEFLDMQMHGTCDKALKRNGFCASTTFYHNDHASVRANVS